MMSVPALLQRAHASLNAGRLADAEQLCRAVLKTDRRRPEAMHMLARALFRRGGTEEAIQWMRKVILAWPDGALFFAELGNMCIAAGQSESAARYHQRSAELEPGNPDYLSNAAISLSAIGNHNTAIELSRRALALKPEHLAARSTLGIALKSTGDFTGAIVQFRKAVQTHPHFFIGWANLSQALADHGALDEALSASKRAMEIDPVAQTANHLLLNLYLQSLSPQQVAEEHLYWGKAMAARAPAAPASQRGNFYDGRRLRVGYVSADFREHAVTSFFEPLLAHHDRLQIETYCYANSGDDDQVTRRLKNRAEHWRQIDEMTDEAAAALIREDGIDILVDLSGHTTGNRLPLFARKPAPVQMTYLGYPATTGLPNIDYRLTDALCDPPGLTDALHSERLIRLPNCFLCYRPPADACPVAPPPARENNFVTFGSFNIFKKLNPAVIEVWASVLRQTPNSRMLIKAGSLQDPVIRAELHERFAQLGIDAERIELVAWTSSFKAHLELYSRIDIALDTFPYHGTTTTCEALWMGVAVVTLAGASHVSRVGVSLLSNLDLQELIAETREQYVQIAGALAGDISRQTQLRQTMRARMRASPLLDAGSCVRKIESAYQAAWHTYRQAELTRING